MLPSDLLAQAQAATPPGHRSSKWAHILPAVEILVARRFSLTEAIGWLVDRQVVQPAERRSAYYSMVQRLRRSANAAAARSGRRPQTPEPHPADD